MRFNLTFGAVLLTASVADAAVAHCAPDPCLNALKATQTPGRLQSAQAFCAKYTTTKVAPSSVPTYAANVCKGADGCVSSRLSSACSCIATGKHTSTTKHASATKATSTVKHTTTTKHASSTKATSTSNHVSTTKKSSSTKAASTTKKSSSTKATSTTKATTATGACAKVSSAWAAQATPTATIAASVALECLQSVPLGKTAAINLVNAIEPYLEWQSDAAYKKNPPKDYSYPGYDMFANLAKVKSNLQANKYKNEYEFQTDLYKTVFAPGHDGHFTLYPDLLSKAFSWRRPFPLVSISKDGQALPEIKLYNDVKSNPKTASAIKTINGIEASKFVQDAINVAGGNQDVDAAYNSMFFEVATIARRSQGEFYGDGRISLIYPGANTTFAFANGTTFAGENQAAIYGNFNGVVDGPSFYQKFCTGAFSRRSIDASSQDPQLLPRAPKAPPKIPQLVGYPKPVISTSDSVVSGYYLSGKGLENVAVLAVNAFESRSPAEFQAVVQDFLHEAAAAGKTKLVIDLQGNHGGYILQGYDFFGQLFPDITPDGFTRQKANKAFMAIARQITGESATVNPYTSDWAPDIRNAISIFNYRSDLNFTNDKFLTFEDKFTPRVFQDTSYTALIRENLTNAITTSNSTFGLGIEISGTGSRSNLTQHFAPENMILLYDGACASTCTIASEMIRISGGVKSVAFGGRPKPGPIQGVGGVKGSQVLRFDDVYNFALVVQLQSEDAEAVAEANRYTTLPMSRSTTSTVNVRDHILRDHVKDGLPAQFVHEDADCRMHWTAPMITDVSEVWKAAANAAFNGAKCAWGGISKSGKVSSLALASPKAVNAAARIDTSPRQRLSELVDTRPQVRSNEWLAVHQQKAVY